MIWILVIIIVAVIYNAEKMPAIIASVKKDIPNVVEVGKKASKELKEKAKNIHENQSKKTLDD